MVFAAPVVMAQERGRTRGAKAKDRVERKGRSASNQRARTERGSKASRRRPSSRSSKAKGRGRKQKKRQKKRQKERGEASARRRAPVPRQETQRRRQRRVRPKSHRPPKAAKPKRHRKSNGWKSKRWKKKHWNSKKRRKEISIDIDLVWPWPNRHRRTWRPRYRYRQVVHVRSVWGSRRRATHVDVRTRYHHRVRYADARRAEVDIYLEAIELYAEGRYLGTVDRIPSHLRRVRATLYRDGRARLDRELFLVGDPHAGFELIATRAYDDYVLGAYHRGDWVKAGALDLHAGEVVPLRRSRLFRPHDFNGWAPVSLLPEDLAWRIDVGFESVSARPYHARSGAHEAGEDYYYSSTPGDGRGEAAYEPVRRTRDDTFRIEAGARISMTRDVQLKRLR